MLYKRRKSSAIGGKGCNESRKKEDQHIFKEIKSWIEDQPHARS
jgi:hypothetical protein